MSYAGSVQAWEVRATKRIGWCIPVIAEEGAATGVVNVVGNDGMMVGSRRDGREWVKINHQDTKATSVGLHDILSLSFISLSGSAITFYTHQVILTAISTIFGHK